MKLVVATKNKNKFTEIQNKLGGIAGLEIVSLLSYPDSPEVVEDGDTFESNALKKARIIAQFTGLPALADDSGLAVAALGGRPGVLSARYGGTELSDSERNLLLLKELDTAGVTEMSACFVCVIAVAMPGGETCTARGECRGIITDQMKGDRGFGYDPIFYLPELNRTMAELSMDEKNRISHRGLALDRAREIIESLTRSA